MLSRIPLEWRNFFAPMREKKAALMRILQPSSLNQAVELLAVKINEITGYSHCEALKRFVDERNEEFNISRHQLKEAKCEYEESVKERSLAQRELNGLLQRKHLWNDKEVERFTELYRSEIRLEQNEVAARQRYNELEKENEERHHQLMDAIRSRYQEEQLWSDKIRRASTIGTFSLMGVNLALFVVLQMFIEPRKRRQLLNEFKEAMQAQPVAMSDEQVSMIGRSINAAAGDSSLLTGTDQSHRSVESTVSSMIPTIIASAVAALIVSLLSR